MKAANAGLSRRLLIALLTPVVLLVAVGAVLALQVSRMAADSAWVDHTDEVIAKASDVHRRFVDQETGLRGFLVSGDRAFLEPYQKARPLDPLAELRFLVADNPAQVARADEIRKRYETWLADAAAVTQSSSLEEHRKSPAMLGRKQKMDDVRALIDAFVNVEHGLRRERVAAQVASTRTTKLAFGGLLSALALTLVVLSRRQLTAISETYGSALEKEQVTRSALERQAWIRTGLLKVTDCFQGEKLIEESGALALETLCGYAKAEVAALYSVSGKSLQRRAGFALPKGAPETISFGEGVFGQVASTRRLVHLRDVPPAYLRVSSALGEKLPAEVVVLPAQVESELEAVLELAFLHPIDEATLELLGRVAEATAFAVRSARIKGELRELLEQTQRQAEELQTQQEELRVSNEELQEQTNALKTAQEELSAQQEELEATNVSLEEKANELQMAQDGLVDKASALERASQYKSEFLANMSHELRTPLNSTLILAKLLADNGKKNLTAEQVRFAETIYAAGNDLLTLINDILDLSKIEAGHLEVQAATVQMDRVIEQLTRTFEPVATQKRVKFETVRKQGGPQSLETDLQRLQQILKNLLSNAFKFTEAGSVRLEVSGDGELIVFRVTDTGIGIPVAQQAVIFEAFRQADGTTNRKYGGTGLGLSISRELAQLLGGELQVESSQPGKGSTFRLTLPRTFVPVAREPGMISGRPPPEPRAEQAARKVTEARAARKAPAGLSAALQEEPRPANGRTLLIVEDDPSFAEVLAALGRELDYHCYVANTAEEGLALARRHLPTAVILDVGLPDRSGLSVLERLKRDPATRHLPIHIVSGGDYAEQAMSMGAVGYMLKPVKREQLESALAAMQARVNQSMRKLLVVEDDARMRASISALLGGESVECVCVGSVKAALEALRSTTFDCVVTDLTLEDGTGYDLLETMARDEAYAFPPVIVYTGRDLSPDEETRLRRYSKSVIVKGARSPERLLDEAMLFLHQVESTLPPERRRLLETARDREKSFEGRTVLVVEDDVRNVFALTSVLEPLGTTVLIARNGREALTRLDQHPGVDAVLMDIMMPEMDGLQATRAIRKQPRFLKLPIIALTAKAMPDDRAECLRAGANDYISKPLDVDTLISLMRVWMRR